MTLSSALNVTDIVADLAEKNPGRLSRDGHDYECHYCGVLCDPDIGGKQLDIADHSHDCLWRRGRIVWQILLDEDALIHRDETVAELEWISRQWDDSQPAGVLATRLYDVTCTALRMLTRIKRGMS